MMTFIIGFLSCWAMITIIAMIICNTHLVEDEDRALDYLIAGPFLPLILGIQYLVDFYKEKKNNG